MLTSSFCDEIDKTVCRFIWGLIDSSRPISLVAWNSIFQPTSCGGLGIRNIKNHNIAFWHSLAKIWPSFYDCLAWFVGGGSLIHFWFDHWLPDIGPLHRWIAPAAVVDPNTCLNEFVLPNGDWNVSALQLILLSHVFHFIQQVRPLNALFGKDCCYWRIDPKHLFSVKSVYSLLSSSNRNVMESHWCLIWKLSIPER
ncbi:hypothetical protein GQ457_03G021740 [Hibiscus cannabinus]